MYSWDSPMKQDEFWENIDSRWLVFNMSVCEIVFL